MDKVFKSLADINRRRIIKMLSDGEKSVNTIVSGLPIGQATVSTHLAVLRKSGLVNYRVLGKNRLYSLNKVLLDKFIEEWEIFLGRNELKKTDEIIVRR